MTGHDIIVVGTSAGGVGALTELVKDLPLDLPAAIFVVLHVPSYATSVLPNILNRCGLLKASHPSDGEEIQHGRIYVAPPDYHLLVKQGHIHLARGPRENGHRPAIDPLFRTAARFYGRRTVGVILSGNLDDGTAGLIAVKMQGGVAVVQDPNEALFSGMPRSAIENVEVDHILPLSAIAPKLVRLAQEPVVAAAEPVTGEMEIETDIAELDMAALQKAERPGTPSGFACPECGGALWELREGELIRFRCRTGHAFSAQALLAEQSENLETALWTGLRALEEKAALARRMFAGARSRNQPRSAARFEQQARESQQNAAIIRQLLLKGDSAIPQAESGEQNTAEVNPNLPTTVVAVAASAGGLKALSELLSALPQNFPAAIAIVQHLSPHNRSQLAEILNRRTLLNVKQATQGDPLHSGSVYIAPPDSHLLVNVDGTLCLTKSELVHFVRPSADLLFESVAASFKEQAIAVVLTGTGVDGASGVKAIKKMGGIAIAQNQASSEYFGMPGAAIETGLVDFILPLNEIANTLVNLTVTG